MEFNAEEESNHNAVGFILHTVGHTTSVCGISPTMYNIPYLSHRLMYLTVNREWYSRVTGSDDTSELKKIVQNMAKRAMQFTGANVPWKLEDFLLDDLDPRVSLSYGYYVNKRQETSEKTTWIDHHKACCFEYNNAMGLQGVIN